MASPVLHADPASFRDPGGTVYFRNGILLRQINGGAAQNDYEHLMRSGLYDVLAGADRLVPHEQAGLDARYSAAAGVVIRPDRVPFISYPYEWCFGQLKDAALLTLRVQRDALGFGMSLKDASAYNVQFWRGSRPVFIDTLSFERYVEGAPWVAYRQFCQHFLAPLALIAKTDARLGRLSQTSLDGVPLDLAARLLPPRSRLDPALLTHVYLHARAQDRHAADNALGDAPPRAGRMSRNALLGLLDSLEAGVRRLNWRPGGTEWSDYYDNTNYEADAFESKKRLVARLLETARSALSPQCRVCDLGANTGIFSRVASERGIFTLALDADPAAVEKNYRACQASGEQNLLPLVQDLTNPSAGVGWAGEERPSFLARWTATESQGSGDVAFALALVHHLALGNNVPLAHVARLLSRLAEFLVIEWVPREDSQARRLLARRAPDAFPDYTPAGFEAAFGAHFTIRERAPIPGTSRTLYLMRRRRDAAASEP